MHNSAWSPIAILFCFIVSLPAQDFRAVPSSPKQGDLIEVFGTDVVRQVRLNGLAFPSFPQPESSGTVTLIPIPVRMAPENYKLEWLDQHGTAIHAQEVKVLNAHFLVQNVQLTPALSELHATDDERNQVKHFFESETPVRYWRLPIKAPLQSCLTSPFGVQRAHNGKLTGDIHAGLDQRGALGTPIHAVAAGEVRLTGQFELHGGTVGIDHGQGLKSMYLHMSKIAVRPGEHVAAGDIIGYVGSTGRSTAPHLHWALYAQGEPVNPLQWLKLQPCAKQPVKKSVAKASTSPS